MGDALANSEESERLNRASTVIDVAVQVVHMHTVGDVLGKFGNLSTDKVQFFPNKLRQLSAVQELSIDLYKKRIEVMSYSTCVDLVPANGRYVATLIQFILDGISMV